MSHFKEKLVAGMVKNGYSREFAERTFRMIEGFGSYGFPESHAEPLPLFAAAEAVDDPPLRCPRCRTGSKSSRTTSTRG